MPDPRHPPPPAPKTFVAGRVVGDYEIIGELGRGGMGVVYRARQLTLNRVVGLKMLTGHYGPEELRRFLAEAETAAGLHHTNIVQIYEVGEFDGAPFYSMEYVESGSLADRLRNGPMEDREAARLLISVARALHFAHRNHVVHRDMKPANILLDPEGVPKVADFGIAKRLTANAALTLSGAIIGTPTYMAPEQAKGTSRDVGAPADIYSLGAILYETLAGRPPFLPEESDTALTFRVITEDPVSPAFYRPGVPRDLETICMKCLEKEPRDRYESAAAFAEDLRRYLDDESIVARPPTTVVRTVKWIRRNPWRFVASTALLLALTWGALRLWQWEFYERPRLEYAGFVEVVHGVLEPSLRLDQKDLARTPVHLRLTRSGRSGPITLIEVLNARGRPAVLRTVQNPEAIPIYMEGLLGAQPNSEKAPESTKLEFLYTEGRVSEVTARDRNGGVTWRLLYDRDLAEDSGSTVRARYVNVQGFNAASRTPATHFAAQRDAQGRDVQITFFNATGEPTANGEGVYGYKAVRDADGRHLYVATRSIGDPEGGPAGYAVVFLDGEDFSLTYRTMEDRGPVVLITHPRRAILATKPAHIVPGPEEARVRAWSKAKITSAKARIDDDAWSDLQDLGELNWSFSIPGDTLAKGEHTLEVRLTDENEAEGSDRITFACDLSGRYNPYPMVDPVVRETKFC